MPDLDEFQLCEADEVAAFEFLKRAAPIICGAGMQPATLDLLDSVVKHPTAYGDIAGRTPGLPELAAEWAGPYATEAVGGEGPATVRALVIAALGANAAGDYDMGFRTFANDETEHWNLAGTPLEGVPVFGLYMFKEGERTYCCSLTPSSWAVNLENVFCYPDQDGLPAVNGYGQTAVEAYMDRENPAYEGLDDCYFGFFGDGADLDRRREKAGDVSERVSFELSALRVDLAKLDGFAGSPGNPSQSDPFADMATAQAAFYKAAGADAWEAAREYFQGNSIHPRALCAA